MKRANDWTACGAGVGNHPHGTYVGKIFLDATLQRGRGQDLVVAVVRVVESPNPHRVRWTGICERHKGAQRNEDSQQPRATPPLLSLAQENIAGSSANSDHGILLWG